MSSQDQSPDQIGERVVGGGLPLGGNGEKTYEDGITLNWAEGTTPFMAAYLCFEEHGRTRYDPPISLDRILAIKATRGKTQAERLEIWKDEPLLDYIIRDMTIWKGEKIRPRTRMGWYN